MGSQKMVHAIRSQGWATGYTDKSPDYDGHMSSKQISNLDITSLYPANTRGGEVMRGHGLVGGERGKPILGFLLGLFWAIHPVEMTYHPKEVRMSWDH